MSYFTERNNMRTPTKKTETISITMYSLLLDCCDKYLDNIAWLHPQQCPDGRGVCGLDYQKFSNTLKFEVPDLYRGNYDRIESPNEYRDFDQYSLLDYIEYIGINIKDITARNFHSYFGHDDLDFETKPSEKTYSQYQNEINNIFQKTGLLYILTNKKEIERVVEFDVLSGKVQAFTQTVMEKGTRELLEEAIALYRNPRPENQYLAVEKMWDALERLKTYYSPSLDKKHSVDKIITAMGNNDVHFTSIFETEFKELTTIGNNFRIRHHETTKIDITDNNHYDYFFNRCLSLIALSLQYIQ